ncbi:MAG: class I SAM-dependent methyltransferase [Acidobacteria bacterium]|nr:class I SAM-dependent methyltransferase [Acidobacteriota bacterium]
MNAFGSPAMALGYARSRPPVHPLVIERVRRQLAPGPPLHCALDIGCGAGLSTRPLVGIAERILGIEPAVAMLPYAPDVAPGAWFAAGRAEALPVRDACADLITAAGSLNYADVDAFFREAVRVLRRDGTLVVYDFSQGRSFPDSHALDEWFTEFQRRYPPPRGDARFLDPNVLAGIDPRWRVTTHERFELPIRLTPDFYVDYAMTETNVALALRLGAEEVELRKWVRESVFDTFGCAARDVLFRGYIAYMNPN